MSTRTLTCAERDAILHADGRYEGWMVESGLTDMCGEYGDPTIQTVWVKNGRRIRDVRWPNPDGGEDVAPCEHYELDAEASDD